MDSQAEVKMYGGTAHVGMHGGVAQRAFMLRGQSIVRGDNVTSEMLEGLSPRQIRSFENAGLVKYYTKAPTVERVAAKPKLKRRRKKGG